MNWSAGSGDDDGTRLSRAISLQLARASEALETASDLASSVHEARRAIKRARALVRLVEPWPTSSPTDSTLRDAGRALAPIRDAQVMVLTARDIMVPPTLLEALETDQRHRFSESASVDGPLSEAAELLRSVVVEVPTMTTPEAMSLGLRSSYASVQIRSDPTAGEGPIAERSHKLRKRVKDLRYQLEFLDGGQPKLGRLVRDLHHLTDLLGDANDLATLQSYTASADVLGEAEGAALTAHLEGGMQTLRSEATALSARLFEDDPDTFVRRIGAWVTSPQSRSQGSPQGSPQGQPQG